jgi:hypothetical protein
MRGKSTPRLLKICPALPLFAFASPLSKFRAIFKQSAALLRLSAHAMRCEVRQKAAALFFEKSKSQSEKERGETAAAPNLKKEKTRHPPKERANEKKKDPAKHPKKRKTTRKKPNTTQRANEKYI